MPISPKKACISPGCANTTTGRYCKPCNKKKEAYRGSAHNRGYTSRWAKARGLYLGKNPLCKRCLIEGVITTASIVDHIKPHRGDMKLFWNMNNWQSLCKKCHDKKTLREGL